MKNIVLIFGFLLLAIGGAVGFFLYAHGGKEKPAVSLKPAPLMALPVLGAPGVSFDPGAWKGRAYAVHFFASWCPDCQAEESGLSIIALEHVPFIGIASKDREEKLKDFLAHDGNPFLVVALDDDGKAWENWNLKGVPETFIVDQAGMIRFHHEGPMTSRVIRDDFMTTWRKIAQ